MARPTLISNEPQIVEWIAEGRPYRQIVDLYEIAFGRRLSVSTINNVRKRNDMPPRINHNARLIPWKIEKRHANQVDAVGLRNEGRLRSGLTVNDQGRRLWRDWRNELDASGLVVHYAPEEGWSWVQRRPGIDLDLIREPEGPPSRSSY